MTTETMPALPFVTRVCRVVTRLPRMVTEADDYSWVPMGDVLVALNDIDASEIAYPEGEPAPRMEALLRANALRDRVAEVSFYLAGVRAAIHESYEHDSHINTCDYPGCKSVTRAITDLRDALHPPEPSA